MLFMYYIYKKIVITLQTEIHNVFTMKKLLSAMLVASLFTACQNKENDNQINESMNTKLQLTQEWDKTFPKSDKVDHKKVTFHKTKAICPSNVKKFTKRKILWKTKETSLCKSFAVTILVG